MRRNGEDPVIADILRNYNRAGVTLLAVAGLAALWLGTLLASLLLPERGWAAGLAAGLMPIAGSGALGMLGLSLLQYAHAWLHIRTLASYPRDQPRRWRD